MKYMGSKRRIAKHILPIILKDRTPDQWYVEPFVGGANVIDKVDGKRAGFDINPYLISFLCELRDGWIPFDKITEEQYNYVKTNQEDIWPALVAYFGISCSFGAKWFGGYCRSKKEKRDYILEAKNNALNQAPLLKGCYFQCRSYEQIKFQEKCIIYCDPPYQGTTKYKDKDFNHDHFWSWCRLKTMEGHSVFISEYQAPDDFKCIWEKEQKTTIAANSNYKTSIERLYTL